MAGRSVRRIGVIVQRRDFFGAMLVHLPLLHSLRCAHPEAELVVFSDVKAASVLERVGAVDRREPLRRGFFGAWWQQLRSGCDLVVCLRPRAIGVVLGTALAPGVRLAVHRHGLNRLLAAASAPIRTDIYRPDHYQHLVAALGLAVQPAEAAMQALAARWTDSLELPAGSGPLVAVVPGAGGARKQWGLAHYLACLEALREQQPDLRAVVVLGNDERAWADELPDSDWLTTSIHADVPELAALALASQLVLAGDCGPGHVFQLAGTPGVTLFSNDDARAEHWAAEWWRPRPGGAAIATAAVTPMQELPVAAVAELAAALLADPAQATPGLVRV